MIKGLCCWGNEYCKCLFLGLSRNQSVKLCYSMLIVLGSLAIGLGCLLVQFSEELSSRMGCSEFLSSQTCIWITIYNMMMIGLGIMHFLLFLIMLLRNQLSKIMNEGAWLIKGFFVLLIMLALYALPLVVVRYVESFCLYLSAVWWLIQHLIFIDLVYGFDTKLKDSAEDSPKLHVVRAALALLILMAAVVLNVLAYGSGGFFPVHLINSIVLGVSIVIVLLRVVPYNSLLVCGLIMLYANAIAYFLPPSDFLDSALYQVLKVGFTLMVLFGFLTPGSNRIKTKKFAINELLALNTSHHEQDSRYVSTDKWIVYHYIMAMVTLSLPMFLLPEGDGMGIYADSVIDNYTIFGWVLVYVLYMWSIICGRIYPEQDFRELQNYFKEFQLN